MIQNLSLKHLGLMKLGEKIRKSLSKTLALLNDVTGEESKISCFLYFIVVVGKYYTLG